MAEEPPRRKIRRFFDTPEERDAAKARAAQRAAEQAAREAASKAARAGDETTQAAGETTRPLRWLNRTHEHVLETFKAQPHTPIQPTIGGRGFMRIKPIREWRPSQWFRGKPKAPAFDLDSYAVPRQPEEFMQYLNQKFGINYLPQEVLEAQYKLFGRTAASQQTDIVKNPEPIAQRIEAIAQKKKGNLTFFDVFNRPFGGLFNRRKKDISAIQFYYKLANRGKELKQVELGNGTIVAMDGLSAQHARQIRTFIETSLKKGSKLNEIDLLVTKAKGKIQETQPKIFGWLPRKPALKAAGQMAAAGLVGGALLAAGGQMATRAVETHYASQPTTITRTAQDVVAANYKQPKNFGMPLVAFATEWEAHKQRLPAQVAKSPKYYSAKFVQQWDAFVQRLAKKNPNLKVTPQMAFAFLKGRVQGTQGRTPEQEAWLIVRTAFRK